MKNQPILCTSYFAKIKKLPPDIVPISIALYLPKGVTMDSIPDVAPRKDILFQYKNDNDTEAYTVKYNGQISALNADVIVEKINQIVEAHNCKGAALVCYEKSTDFCHRHLLAAWLRQNGYQIEEWSE